MGVSIDIYRMRIGCFSDTSVFSYKLSKPKYVKSKPTGKSQNLLRLTLVASLILTLVFSVAPASTPKSTCSSIDVSFDKFSCNNCDSISPQINHFYQHVRIIHRESGRSKACNNIDVPFDVFSCNSCDSITPQINHFYQHIRIIHREYGCSKARLSCDVNFAARYKYGNR